jgi:hypothetical protein
MLNILKTYGRGGETLLFNKYLYRRNPDFFFKKNKALLFDSYYIRILYVLPINPYYGRYFI